MTVSHISFSALKNWVFCPFYHKITYIDRIKGFLGNEYTAFGTAIHTICEKKLLKEEMKDPVIELDSQFVNELARLPEEVELITSICDFQFPGGPNRKSRLPGRWLSSSLLYGKAS